MNQETPTRDLEPLYIAGPTASGKSGLAIALAERIGGEIVNADAFQLYRGMAICTAQPRPEDLARVPHHLYGVFDPAETMDAFRYSELAQFLILSIAERGKVPIVVGGSGLYLKALTHGLIPLPNSTSLRARLEHLTAAERIAWLLHRDPAAAQTVNLKNDRYVGRALEICLLTGQPQSELRKAWSLAVPTFRGIQLIWSRDALSVRIDQRARQMITNGLVPEIAALGPLSSTAEKAIGVRDIADHLAGRCTLEQSIANIQLATRQYARRQEKWFRREKGLLPLPMEDATAMDDLVAAVLHLFPQLQSQV